MPEMISLPVSSGRFNFRAAVWLHEGHVLLQGDSREDFWALPGGRVEHMEPAQDAIHRELTEELAFGSETRIERLLWIVQNFFSVPEWGGNQHELGLYFLITPEVVDVERLRDKSRAHMCVEPDSYLTFRWFPLATLAQTQPLRPTFLNTALLHLPATPQLITHSDI